MWNCSHCFLIRSRSAWILSSFTFISMMSTVFLNSSSALILEFKVARTTQSQKMNETIEMIVCGCKNRVWMSIFYFLHDKSQFSLHILSKFSTTWSKKPCENLFVFWFEMSKLKSFIGNLIGVCSTIGNSRIFIWLAYQ